MHHPFQYTAPPQTKDPPPYYGHVVSQGFQHSAGHRQSYASSEAGSTDLSLSSCENLSLSLRQDPQGEETHPPNLFAPTVEIRPLPDYFHPPSGVEVKSTNSSTFYVTGNMASEGEGGQLTGYSSTPPVTGQPYTQQPHLQQQQYYTDTPLNPCSDQQSQNTVPAPKILQATDSHPKQSLQSNQQYPASQVDAASREQQAKKQDQFKKWRHFYVNENTPMQEYRQMSEEVERPGEGGYTPQYPVNTQYQNKPTASQHQGTPSLGSGSMIAKLRQEFGKDNPPDHNYNIPKASDRNMQLNTNDRMRSATPDFLSDRLDSSKQLPLRPSSANARQSISQKQNLPLGNFKVEPLSVNNRFKSSSEQKQKSPDVTRKNAFSLFNEGEKFQEPKKSQSQSFGNKSPEVLPTNSNVEHMLKWPSLPAEEEKGGVSLTPFTSEYGSKFSSVTMDSKLGSTPVDTLSKFGSSPMEPSFVAPESESSERCNSAVDNESVPAVRSVGDSTSEGQYKYSQQRTDKNSLERSRASELDHAAIATRATQMVERLSAENSSLRQELEGYYTKVCRLQKFEFEIQKVTDAYESLVKHSTKRENLDKVMRLRLETEVKKLRESNQDLKDQLEKALCKVDQSGAYAMTPDCDVKKELREKDAMITKLIVQSREVSQVRDRLELELSSEKACSEEHQNHVQVLEASLKRAHADKFTLQGQLQKQKADEEKMKQLHQAFSHLQAAAEKRESIERRLRSKLEEEIRSLKHQKSGDLGQKASDTDEGISSDCESGPGWMRQQVNTLRETVLRLEAEVAHYQQRYLEEQALRQLTLSATLPRDMKMVALEQSSQETERLMSESKSERLQHLEDLYNANRKSAEFEAKVKTLESQLLEKEAMIRVLEKHTLCLSRTSSVSSLFTPAAHSPHQSMPARQVMAPTTARQTMPNSPALSHRQNLAVHHAKSNSDGAMLDTSALTAGSLSPQAQNKEATTAATLKTNKSLRQLMTAQAEIFRRWKNEDPGELSKECWQV